MKQIIKIQLIVQLTILSILLILLHFAAPLVHKSAVFAGGAIAVVFTLVAWFLFRRMPKAVSGSVFFGLMIVYEVLKWLVLYVLLVMFLTKTGLQPLGIVIGFFTTYLLSHFVLLKVK